MSTPQQREQAIAIWRAGVEAVKPEKLVSESVHVEDGVLHLGPHAISLQAASRLVIVGAGKASAGLATALESQVIPQIARALPDLQIDGLVNCPEGTFDPDRQRVIDLLAARPAGENVPTELAVAGTERILNLVSSCAANDVVICLLSGGGSALLTAPRAGISLADKQHVARVLAAAGANIEQLNTVRRALSRVKGGGLARACSAGRLITLVVSDVLGDSLQTIASGPTVLDAAATPQAALQVLNELGLQDAPELSSVVANLRQRQDSASLEAKSSTCQVQHVLLGNNATAVEAAQAKAIELGYPCQAESATESEPSVTLVAERLCNRIGPLTAQPPQVWVSGGEPTVQLPEHAGRGGRNQQLALEVMQRLAQDGWPNSIWDVCFVSGGTDGEDGPTDAAGAVFDEEVYRTALRNGLNPQEFLDRADAYPFFEQTGGLLKTGPTGTNVCDLRVALIHPSNPAPATP